ncbi:MAG: crossover junction endodeoxyribonuclease RuvC, partial [Acidobacteria bacterium]
MTSRVIGIDPGSAATGWAVVTAEGNRYHLVDFGVIRAKGDARPARLADLAGRMAAIIEEFRP